MSNSNKLTKIYNSLNEIRGTIAGTVSSYTKLTGLLKITVADYRTKLIVGDVINVTIGVNTANVTITEITNNLITGTFTSGLDGISGAVTILYKNLFVYAYPIDPKRLRYPFCEVSILDSAETIRTTTQYTSMLKYNFVLMVGVISERDETSKQQAQAEILDLIDTINNKLKLEINKIKTFAGVTSNNEVYLGQIELSY